MTSFVETKAPNSPASASANNSLITLLQTSIKNELAVLLTKTQAKAPSSFSSSHHPHQISLVVDDHQELNRLLIARKNNLLQATKMGLEMISLRSNIDIMNMPTSEFATPLDGQTLRWSGYDKEGSPIFICRAKTYAPWTFKKHEYRNYTFFILSLIVASMTAKSDKFVVIFNLAGFRARMGGLAATQCSKAMIDVVQKCFPERCKTAFLVEHPKVFSFLWKMVAPMINERTRSKVAFLDGDAAEWQAELKKVIDPAMLELDMGGTKAECYPIHEFPLPLEIERIKNSLF